MKGKHWRRSVGKRTVAPPSYIIELCNFYYGHETDKRTQIHTDNQAFWVSDEAEKQKRHINTNLKIVFTYVRQ